MGLGLLLFLKVTTCKPRRGTEGIGLSHLEPPGTETYMAQSKQEWAVTHRILNRIVVADLKNLSRLQNHSLSPEVSSLAAQVHLYLRSRQRTDSLLSPPLWLHPPQGWCQTWCHEHRQMVTQVTTSSLAALEYGPVMPCGVSHQHRWYGWIWSSSYWSIPIFWVRCPKI